MKILFKAFVIGLLVALAVPSLQSCKPTIPSQYLSKGEMEDILYDIHIVEAMANEGDNFDNNSNMIAYREAIFKKHGVTSAEFDSSMVYYMRHTKLMHDVYISLGERLTADAQSIGVDVSNMNRFGDIASGDTADVWNGAKSLVLAATEPLNYYSFELPVDTGYHKGDKLMLEFDNQFIFQDGIRDGTAVLAVTFANDSVASSYTRISSSQHYTLQMEDRDSLGIKSVKGYFMLNHGDFFNGTSSETTLKMMFVQGIRMVRQHARKAVAVEPTSEAATDSAVGKTTSRPLNPAEMPNKPGNLPGPSGNQPTPNKSGSLPAPKTSGVPTPGDKRMLDVTIRHDIKR